MALKSARVEVYQLYGEGSLNELSRAVESFRNDGWQFVHVSLSPVDSTASRFRGVYVFERVVNVLPELPLVSEVVNESVVDAVNKGKVGKKVTE